MAEANVGKAVGYLDLDIEGFEAGLKEAKTTAKGELASIEKEFDGYASRVTNTMDGVASHMTKTGTAMTIGLTAPIAAASAAILTFTNDVEKGFAKVETIADTTQKSMSVISDEIISLSNATGEAVTELSEATYQAISAGVSTAQSVEFVNKANKLAVGGFAEITASTDLLTTVMNSYGYTVEDVDHISNVLITTQNKGKTTVGELSTVMGKIIPVAQAFGVGLEDISTSYAVMTANGIATAEATTYLRGALNELGKTGTVASDALLASTGKTFTELIEEGLSLHDVFSIIEQSAADSGLAINDMFGSQEAGLAALSLLSKSTEDYDNILNDMMTTTGDVDEAFGTMADTTEYKTKVAIEKAKNSTIALGTQLQEMLLPAIEDGSELVEEFAEWLENLTDEEKENIIQTAAMVAATGPLLVVGGNMIKMVSSAIKAYQTLTAVMAASNAATLGIVGVAGLAVTGIAAMAAASSEMGEQNEYAGYTVEDLTDKIDENTEAYYTNAEARAEAVNGQLSELGYIENISQELEELINKNSELTDSEKARAEFITGELNSALGTEYNSLDLLAGEYDVLKEKVYELIEAKRAEILLQALEQNFSEAIQNEAQARQDATTAAIAFNEVEAERNALLVEREEIEKKIAEGGAGYADNPWLAQDLEEVNAKLFETSENYEDIKRIAEESAAYYGQIQQDITNYENASIALSEGNAAKVQEIYNSSVLGVSELQEEVMLKSEENMTRIGEDLGEAFSYLEMYQENYLAGVEGFTEEGLAEAENNAAELYNEYKKAGGNIVDGIVDGINAELYRVVQARAALMAAATGGSTSSASSSGGSGQAQQANYASPVMAKSIGNDNGIMVASFDDPTAYHFDDHYPTLANDYGASTFNTAIEEMQYVGVGNQIANNGSTNEMSVGDNSESAKKVGEGKEDDGSSGDTFIFNSPKVIDEEYAAQLIELVKKDLVEGY